MYYSLRGYTRAQLLAMLPELALGEEGGGSGWGWAGTRLHNVYDDHDPVAYRLTPLFFDGGDEEVGAVSGGESAAAVAAAAGLARGAHGTSGAATAATVGAGAAGGATSGAGTTPTHAPPRTPPPERVLTLASAPAVVPVPVPAVGAGSASGAGDAAAAVASLYSAGVDVVIPRQSSVVGAASTLRGTAFEVVQEYVDAFQAHQGYWSAPELLLYIAGATGEP